MQKKKLAFTLVELLVVIAIIGILVGLLLPAIGAVQERARLTQCTNNLKNLGLGVIQFENRKGSFPGYVNKYGVFAGGSDPSDPGNFSGAVPRHVKVGGYGVPLLQFLDAQPTYELWTGDRYPILADGSGEQQPSRRLSGDGFHPLAAPNLAVFQCPSNPLNDGSNGLNSYITNNGMTLYTAAPVGFSQTVAAAETKHNGVFNAKYNGAAKIGVAISADDLKDGLGTTLLMTESVQAVPWHRPGFLNGADCLTASATDVDLDVGEDASIDTNFTRGQMLRHAKYTAGAVWHPIDEPGAGAGNLFQIIKINGGGASGPNGFLEQLTGVSPQATVDPNGETISSTFARPTSAHSGGVVAVFADGSTKFIAETINYRVFQAIMTPRGKASDVPFAEFVLTDELN